MTKNLDDDESESYKIRASGIIEHIPDPTFAIDTKGRVIAWNRAIEEMTGIPASDIIGKGNHEYSLPFYNRRQPTLINFFEIPEKKLREMGYKIIKRTDNAISIDSTEVQIKGKKYYVKANASRIYDESGNIAGAIESLTDITEKREAQTLIDNLLLEQEELLEIVNKSPAVAFLWKAEENWPVEKVSANISQFGYSVEDFISGRVIFSSIIHPDDLKQVAYEVEYNSSNNIDEFIQTYRILGKDKTEYWIEDFTHIRRNKKGIITHYQGIIINITERKKAEEALERSYAVLNGVIESPKDVVIFALDRQYCYAAFNENHRQTMKQIWGADIATGNSMLEYIKSPEDQKKAKINFDRALSGESFTVIEEYGDSALERRWYEDIYNPVTDENGNIIGLTLFLTDITKRKKMEEELKESEYRFRELFNSMHSGVVVYNAIDKGADFEIVNFNHGAEIIEKIKKQDVIGKRVSEAFPGVEEFGLLKVFQRVWRTGKPEHHPISLYQDEHIISWRENYVYRLPSGEIVAIYDDVTEARKAEEALAKEKNTIDFIIDSMPGMFYIISETSLFVRWNKNLETLTGYSAEELSKMGPQDLVDKKDLEVMFNAMKEAFTEGYAELEAFVVAKDGKKTQYLFSGHGRIIDDKPYLIGAALDLSRTKEAEKALIKEKNTTDYILESLPGMFYILDTKGRFVRWNKNSGMITGYSEDEISKMGPNDFIADKDKERVSDAVTNAFSEGYADVEADIVTKEGKKIPFFFSAFSRVIDDTPYLLGMALDITRTKEAEKEIAKLAAIVRHSGEFICLADTDGQITFINEAGAKLVGIEQKDISKYHVWDIVPDSMKEKVRSEIYPSMMQKGFWEGEQQYQNIKTGKLIDVHLMTFTIRDPDTGAPMYYANVSLDITEIKKANKAVVKEKKTVDYILESLPGMFYMFDSKGRFVRWNKNFETITGHSGDEILKISPLENIIDKDKDRVSNAINNAFSKGYDEVEAVIVTKDGKKIPFFFSAYRKIIDNTPYILGMGLDITKTKEAEKEIAKLALIVQHSGEFIALADKDGKATFINEAGAKLVGIEQNDISKYKMGDLFASDIKEKLNAEVIPAITKKGSWEGDLQYINLKTGVPVDVHTMSFSIKDPETKEPLYLANVSLDITARKRAEEALAREKANVEYILDSLPGMFYMFYMIDEKGQFVRWNKNLETLTGYSAEEVLKMKPLEFIDIRYKDLVNESLSKAFSEGYADMEANIVTKDGKRIPFFFSANKQIIDNTPYILGMGLDITTTKDAEKEIAKLAAIVQNSGEFIALADNEGQLTFINEAGAKMVGINRNNISMYKIVDVLPNDQQEKLNSEILPTLKEKGFWKGDLRYRNINTEKLTDVHAMTFTITDPDTDKTLYLANVSLNITDRKNAEAALKEVNKKLNLLGSITRHDILNQVTGAQGYMEILEMDGALPPNSKIEKYCSKIQGAIETIKRQILFTKDYKDLGEQSPEWYNVKDIINNNYKNLGFKEIKLINETENLEVYADPLFEKVIYNLFDNAVKHGDKITIINFYFKESEDHLDLICEDDGVGIPEEYKEKIFKREYYKNTGLGLFLSREILSITGLSIEETGEFGKGAKFVIHIPKEMFRFGEL